jgi:ribonuclease G
VAVSEEGRLEEFNIERTTEERLVGSIFKGKVRNLEDGLKAAFVDIGFEKNAFLHYWDIVPSSFDSGVEIVERERQAPGQTENNSKGHSQGLSAGSDIIVQVTKGPIGTKGPRVTTNLVLPGRYPRLVAQFRSKRHLAQNRKPAGTSALEENSARTFESRKGMGVIMRTVGEGQQKRYFVRDLALLLEEWYQIQDRHQEPAAGHLRFPGSPDLIERTVRDFLTEDVERIVVDSQKAYERMREMISKISKRSANKVKLYSDPQPIFDRFNITRQLENAFSRQVHLKSGGYIVVDETEALVAIDVNTGRHKGGKDQETSISR